MIVNTVGQTLVNIRAERPRIHRQSVDTINSSTKWAYDRLLQHYNTAEPKQEHAKILLVNLGQIQKKPNKKGRQDSDIGILEMAEPDSRNSGV